MRPGAAYREVKLLSGPRSGSATARPRSRDAANLAIREQRLQTPECERLVPAGRLRVDALPLRMDETDVVDSQESEIATEKGLLEVEFALGSAVRVEAAAGGQDGKLTWRFVAENGEPMTT